MQFLKIFLFIILLLPFSAKAVGLSVNPSSLEILLPSIKDNFLTIKNISNEPIITQIYLDDFSDDIIVEPNEMQLLPDEVVSIKIISSFPEEPSGFKQTNISIISKALNKKSFNAISGLKIPVNIHITESYFQWSASLVFLIVFLSLLSIALVIQVIFLILKKRRSQRKKIFDINFVWHHKRNKWRFWQ